MDVGCRPRPFEQDRIVCQVMCAVLCCARRVVLGGLSRRVVLRAVCGMEWNSGLRCLDTLPG